MRRGMGGLLVALCAIGIGACSDSTAPKESVTGTYSLTSVANLPLPATVYQDATETDELTSGSITLSSGNRWNGVLRLRITTSTGVDSLDANDGGTFTVNGSALTLNLESDGSQMNGSVGGGTLTLLETDGMGQTVALVFKK